MTSEDTIVAIATPPGRGGIGVVRLSGTRALEFASTTIQLRKCPPEAQRAILAGLRDPASGRVLDQVIVTFYRGPHSYTTEDVVEISCHGAPVVLNYLVERCLQQGARMAEPGEFTMRAFLNGRIDLTQAEAIRDLIEARTLYQARVAAQQMDGAVSSRLRPHKQTLMELIARLEAGIDFAEDDVSIPEPPEILMRVKAIQEALAHLAKGCEYGKLIREGLSLAIVGRPNVGKSSIFNRLLNQERAIVTASPGTTRDLVSESASISGIPLRFVDTAGIRHATDEAEAKGVEKTYQAIADSDLRLLVADASEGWTAEDHHVLGKTRPLGPLVIACNKSDLPHRIAPTDFERILAEACRQHADLPAGSGAAARVEVVWTSALTGEGIAELQDTILELAAPGLGETSEDELITNLRHQQLLNKSLEGLNRACQGAEHGIPHEMLLLDLYDALHALDEITGETRIDDILNVIFSTFCVGK